MTNLQIVLVMVVPLIGILVNVMFFTELQAQIAGLRSSVDMPTGKVIEIVDRVAHLEPK